MAVYPTQIVSFQDHADFTSTILAAHPNVIHAEVEAIQETLGINPKTSTSPTSSDSYVPATTFSTVNARLANIEKGLVGDSHTQYLKLTGGTVSGNVTLSSDATIKNVPAPSTGTDAVNKTYVDTAINNQVGLDVFLFMGA